MTQRGRKTANVRFYIDADLLGLAKVLVTLRADVTYPGDPGGVIHRRERPPCPITNPAAKDVEWLPETAKHGWLIITRDRHIRDHRAEIAAVREHRAKMIALSGPDATTKFAQLEIVMCRWREIEKLAALPGPFIYQATRTSLRRLDLTT